VVNLFRDRDQQNKAMIAVFFNQLEAQDKKIESLEHNLATRLVNDLVILGQVRYTC
jgi:hypothetical protein